MILSYKYRIEPNRTQAALFDEMLRDFCQLYNGGLEHRIEAYRKGVSITFYDQCKELTIIRRDMPEYSRWSCGAQQQVLRRLDKALKSFFRRVKSGKKPGFPRFRANSRYHSADFCVGNGLAIHKSGKIHFAGIPNEIKVRYHRELPSKPKSATLTRQAGKWYIIFNVDVEINKRARLGSIGIDLGLTSLVALSNGETIARPNWTKRAAKGLRTRQRAVARCKKGSKIRCKRVAALATYHSNTSSRRRDFCHKLTHNLVNRFGQIAIEDLNIKGLASGMFAKHVHDAAWAQIASMLDYKAAKAGGRVIKVDPRGTSQTCPECGTIAAKTLSERKHRCKCGCVLDRDVAAAMVIHFRAFNSWPGAGLKTLSQRAVA